MRMLFIRKDNNALRYGCAMYVLEHVAAGSMYWV